MWLSLRLLVLLSATASAALAQSVAPSIQTASSPKITLASVQQPATTKRVAPAQHALPVQPKVANTDQDVLLLFAGRSANDKVLLTLNNNRPDKLTAELTVYDLSGYPRTLPSLDLNASESRLLDFSGVLRSLNVMAPLGFLKVHYMGKSMELGSQLTLYPIENRGGLDSPRSLKVDYASTERHAVAWTPPGSSVTFSITNVATTPIDAALTVNGRAETVHLEANQTAIRTREAVEELTSPMVDLDVNFTGPIDALRVFGFVASPHDGTLPVRTYDPKGATSSVLSAVGLNTKDETHASVRNLSAAPVLITPLLTPVGADTSKAVTGVPLLVPASTSIEVPLQPYLLALEAKGVTRATLFLKNDAPAGALVGALDQRIAPDVLEDVPFKTANPPRYMRGAYPLRWEGDYTNAPMIANTSTQQAKVRVYVIAGGVTYTFADSVIAPGATTTFDVDTIRQKQIADSMGKKIPLTAMYGKFHWTPLPSKEAVSGLNARTELTSIKALRASSFSCGMDCPYNAWYYPYFDNDVPWGSYPDPYLQDAREVTMHDYYVDTYGNPSSRGITASGLYPYGTNDSSILSTAEINNGLTLRMDTGHGGTTHFYYAFTENTTYISSTDDGNPGTCTVQTDTSDDGGDTDVSPCPIPTGESTQFVRQALTSPAGAPTTSDFIQTLATVGNDDGNYIIEATNATGTDSCYYSNPSYPPFTSVTGGTPWTVGQISNNSSESQVVTPGHNQWGPDVVGYTPGATRYYQINRPKLGYSLPCGATLHQNLAIQCVQGEGGDVTYKIDNILTSTIDSGGITNCRSGVCAPRYAYP